MDESKPNNELPPERLDALAEEFAQRLRAGESVTIAQFAGREPSHREEVAEFLASILALEELRSGMQQAAESPSSQSSPAKMSGPKPHQQLGDYRLLRELGRGGMGVVYEAMHDTLGRKVALKILPTERLGHEKHQQRFRREARAAARLHHAHIVPVFGLGEAAGYRFYVMERVDGLSLNKLIQQLQARRQAILAGTASRGTFTVVEGDSHGPASASSRAKASNASKSQASATHAPEPRLPRSSAHTTWVASGPLGDPAVAADPGASGGEDSAATTRSEADTQLPLSLPEPGTDEHFRWVATLGQQVAAALAYAHEQGVLHRDIKPGNLMVDRTGQAQVTDFGLAKQLEDPGVSQTGEVVGTPRYMAPEFLEGHADPRSDVYCLGVTLYEMLALQPAFPDASPAQMLRNLTQFQPPRLGSLVRGLPRDLETIVQRAMTCAPSARYCSAAELAEDLERFLDARPILARRTWWTDRLWYWTKRNPAIASLTLISFGLLTTLAIVLAVGNVRLNTALQDVREAQSMIARELTAKASALERAEAENLRAERNLALAMEAFERVMHNISTRGIDPLLAVGEDGETDNLSSSSLTEADVQLLEQLLEFFERFASENEQDFRRPAAAAQRRVADIQQQLGRVRAAEVAYRQALNDYQQLAAESPDELPLQLEQARILIELSKNASSRGAITRAAMQARRARDVLQAHPALLDLPEGQFELARTLSLYAAISSRSGLAYALEWAIPKRRHAARFTPRNARREEAEKRQLLIANSLDESIRLLESLVETFPDESAYSVALGRARREQARWADWQGQTSMAQEALKQSVEVFAMLVAKNPESLSLKYELAESLSVEVDHPGGNARRYQRAEKLVDELLSVNANLPEFRALQASIMMSLAASAIEAGDYGEAQRRYQQAQVIARDLLRQFPATTRYFLLGVRSAAGLVEVAWTSGEREQARQRLDALIADLQRRLDKQRRSPATPALLRALLVRFRMWRRESGVGSRESGVGRAEE